MDRTNALGPFYQGLGLMKMRLFTLISACGLLLILATAALPQDLTEPVHNDPTCPVCRLWDANTAVLKNASLEVGALEQGVVYFFYSNNFRVIEDLQRFAFERKGLEESGAAKRHDRLGSEVEENLTNLEISASPHGAFAILTSEHPPTARLLREQASHAVRNRTLVHF